MLLSTSKNKSSLLLSIPARFMLCGHIMSHVTSIQTQMELRGYDKTHIRNSLMFNNSKLCSPAAARLAAEVP